MPSAKAVRSIVLATGPAHSRDATWRVTPGGGEVNTCGKGGTGTAPVVGKLMGAMSEHWIRGTGRTQAVHAFIENNLEWGDLSPPSVASAIGISVRQLHLLFKPTGISFSRYVLTRRLERARQELANPARNVLEIAMSCGIESSTVFYRAFRRSYGMTPNEYRQSLREAQALGASVASAIEQPGHVLARNRRAPSGLIANGSSAAVV